MLENLKKAIIELNKKDEDGNQQFNFMIREYRGNIELFDANENYHYDYEYEMNCLIRQCAREFGFTAKPYEDKILPQIEEAIQKDLGENAWIEWQDKVTMRIFEN